jgi:hypothetical protein
MPDVIVPAAIICVPVGPSELSYAMLLSLVPAASVNSPIGAYELSYSMHNTVLPAAIIYGPIRVSADAMSAPQAILIDSLVKTSVCKFCDSIAMRLIIK